MPRPKLKRRVQFDPKITYFKPRGVPLSALETVILTSEEIEALRLTFIKNLEQKQAAKEMRTSQSTFWRILESAEKKMAEALILGKAIRIELMD